MEGLDFTLRLQVEQEAALSLINIQIQTPVAHFAVKVLACESTAGNEQQLVLLTF